MASKKIKIPVFTVNQDERPYAEITIIGTSAPPQGMAFEVGRTKYNVVDGIAYIKDSPEYKMAMYLYTGKYIEALKENKFSAELIRQMEKDNQAELAKIEKILSPKSRIAILLIIRTLKEENKLDKPISLEKNIM